MKRARVDSVIISAGAIVSIAAGCTSLNGLAGGSDAAAEAVARDSAHGDGTSAPRDAKALAVDAAQRDAGRTDAKVVDAATHDADAATGFTEAGLSFCAPGDAGPFVYCTNFEDVDAATIETEIRNTLDGADSGAEVESTFYVSPSHSLEVSVPGAAGGGTYNVVFASQPTKVNLDYQVRWDSLVGGAATLVLYYTDTGGAKRVVTIEVLPSGYTVEEQAPNPDGGGPLLSSHPSYMPAGGMEAGVWHRVLFSVTVNDVTNEYSYGLTVDNQELALGVPLQLQWTQGQVTLGVGVWYAFGGAQNFYFDNVRATLSFE